MNCPFCGASVPAESAFCIECGRRVIAQPPEPAQPAGAPAPAKRKPSWLLIVILAVLLGGGGLCVLAGGGGAVYLLMRPTETPIPTATYTPTATWTPTATSTPLPTSTPTATATQLPTATKVPTATKTPTQVVTPVVRATFTPTPPGLIYADDFSRDRKVWYIGEDEESAKEIRDGRFSIQVKVQDIMIRNTMDKYLADVVISVVAYPQPSRGDYEYGISFREPDDDNFYIAGVSLSGQYAFYRFVDNEWEELIPWTTSRVINKEANELRVVCVGSQIAFYANDTLLFQRVDDTFSRGDIGFFVGTWDTPGVEVQFDDFLARDPVTGDMPAAAEPTATPRPANPTATPRPAGATATPRPAGATATPRPSWANSLYLDLVQTRNEYLTIKGWYETLYAGGSVRCPSQTYSLHRPSYVIPPELATLRSIYDRYLAAAAMVDGTGDVIGPLDRIQLLCKEGKNIGQADMDFDMAKLRDAGPILDGLIAEVSALR